MNKTTTLYIILGVIVALNIGLLAFIWSGKKFDKHPPHMQSRRHADRFIQQRFDFDEKQMAAFIKSKRRQEEKTRALEKELHDASITYYNSFHQRKTVQDSLLDEILDITAVMYRANLDHFDDVDKICLPAQKSEMDHFIKGLVDRGRRKKPSRK